MTNPLKKANQLSRTTKVKPGGQQVKLTPTQIINNVLYGRAKFFKNDFANNVKEGYKKSVYVYRCVRERSKAISSVPLVVKQKKKGEEDIILPDHPLQQLLDKPNPHYSKQTLKEFWQMSRLLSGDAYFHLAELDNKLQPSEIYYLRPDRVTIKGSDIEFIDHYIYKINRKKYKVEPAEILHFKILNPTDDLYGMSPIVAGTQTIGVANAVQEWNKVFFDNSARPDGAFVSDVRLTDPEYERAKTEIDERYTGVKNAHRPLLLEGGVDWKEIGKSHKDLDFPELKKWSAIDICVLFEVDPIFVGLPEASTYNNKKEAKKSFWEDTVLHDLEDLVEQINNNLAVRYGDDIYVEADLSEVEALRENENDRVKRINSKVEHNYITLNEARVADGKEARNGMDLTLLELQAMTSGGMQTASLINKAIKKKDLSWIASKTDQEISIKGQLLLDNVDLFTEQEIKAIAQNIELFSPEHFKLWIDFIKTTKPLEEELKDTMDKLFTEQERRVMANLEKIKAEYPQATKDLSRNELEKIMFDKTQEDEWMAEGTSSKYRRSVQVGGERGLEKAGMAMDMAFNVKNPKVMAYLKDKPFHFASQVNSTTQKRLREELMEAYDKGEGIPGIANRVEGLFEGARANRSEMIARTEMNSSVNFGQLEGYNQSGVVELKEWLSAFDERTRTPHLNASGQQRPTDKPFNVWGEELQYPGDSAGSAKNVIMCRCTTLPRVKKGNRKPMPDEHIQPSFDDQGRFDATGHFKRTRHFDADDAGQTAKRKYVDNVNDQINRRALYDEGLYDKTMKIDYDLDEEADKLYIKFKDPDRGKKMVSSKNIEVIKEVNGQDNLYDQLRVIQDYSYQARRVKDNADNLAEAYDAFEKRLVAKAGYDSQNHNNIVKKALKVLDNKDKELMHLDLKKNFIAKNGFYDEVSKASKKKTLKGQEWIKKNFDSSATFKIDDLKVAVEHNPEASGSYTHQLKTLQYKQDAGMGTRVHEFAHAIHEHSYEFEAYTKSFFKERIQGLDYVKLNGLGEASGYKAGFVNNYAGRVYSWEKGNPKGTEVLSVGTQLFYQDPEQLFVDDYGHFRLVQAIRRGLVR